MEDAMSARNTMQKQSGGFSHNEKGLPMQGRSAKYTRC